MHAQDVRPDQAIVDERKESTWKLPGRTAALLPVSDWHRLISCLAYEIYLDRGKLHGHDLDDWLAAEEAVLSQLTRSAKHGGEYGDG